MLKEDSPMIRRGVIPADPMFHLRRFAHISDSCINCGQCEELCPMEIPLALFGHAIREERRQGICPETRILRLLQLIFSGLSGQPTNFHQFLDKNDYFY